MQRTTSYQKWQNLTLPIYVPLIRGLWSSCFALAVLFAQAQTFHNAAPDYNITALPQSINFGSGVSFCDFNNDGLDDLSFTMTNDSLRFYLNNGEGFDLLPSFAYANGEAKHILWVDYDNDGDKDFMLTINDGRFILYQNDGEMNFTDVSEDAGLATVNERHYGASFADYDRDGDLDFYICTYALNPGIDPYHAMNHLYRNNGDGTFTDVTEDAGVGDGVRLSFQSVWIDYDQDGWPDLFVINDRIHANSLYRNNGDGTFEDVSVSAGITFAGQDPMTATVADVDHDGDMDIYLTNTGIVGKMPKMLIDNGDGTFTDHAADFGVTVPDWTWGAVWIDFNNDSSHDLYVTTGNPNPLQNPTQDYFFQDTGGNNFVSGNALFTDVLAAKSFSAAKGDVNNDGYADIAVLNKDPWEPFIWENSGGDNNYVKISVQGTASNRDAIGTWIRVYAGENTYTHYTLCGENYLAQNSQHHIFGLGDLTEIDSLTATYPSGHMDVYYDLPVNTHHTLIEGDTYTASISADGPLGFCEGGILTLSGGIHESYLWSTGDTTQEITVTTSGTYTLLAGNASGVTASDTVVVEVFPAPDLLESIVNVSCADSADASILLENTTGVATASCIWNHGASGTSLTGLSGGTYFYTYTDVNGCTVEDNISIYEPDPLLVETYTQSAVNGNDGILIIFVSGGFSPYTIAVDGETVNENTIAGLPPGTYHILVTDANGCALETSDEIELLSAAERMEAAGFTLYPNPASNQIHIELSHPFQNPELIISDPLGRVLITHILDMGTAHSVPVDLPAGIYFARLANGPSKSVVRFVVL